LLIFGSVKLTCTTSDAHAFGRISHPPRDATLGSFLAPGGCHIGKEVLHLLGGTTRKTWKTSNTRQLSHRMSRPFIRHCSEFLVSRKTSVLPDSFRQKYQSLKHFSAVKSFKLPAEMTVDWNFEKRPHFGFNHCIHKNQQISVFSIRDFFQIW
jgi:hypothetical protein